MKTVYIWIMSITALIAYVLSAVLNQYEYLWTDWSIIYNGFWNFALILGAFHYYRISIKLLHPVLDVIGIFLIGFSSIDLIHSVYCLAVWTFTDQRMNQVLISAFDHYNPFFVLFAMLVAGAAGFLYLINLPDILHKK